MSQRAVEQFIGRLITDPGFRLRASRNVAAVCAEEGYNLSDAERRILQSLDYERLARAEEFWLDEGLKRFDLKNGQRGLESERY